METNQNEITRDSLVKLSMNTCCEKPCQSSSPCYTLFSNSSLHMRVRKSSGSLYSIFIYMYDIVSTQITTDTHIHSCPLAQHTDEILHCMAHNHIISQPIFLTNNERCNNFTDKLVQIWACVFLCSLSIIVLGLTTYIYRCRYKIRS